MLLAAAVLPAVAAAAPVVMDHQSATVSQVSGTRDTETGYLYLPGWSNYFKLKKQDTYKVNMSRTGSTGYYAFVTSAGETAGYIQSPSMDPGAGNVKTFVMFQCLMWSNGNSTRNFMPDNDGNGGLVTWNSGAGTTIEIRPKGTAAPAWTYGTVTDSDSIAPSFSPANANTIGQRVVMVIVMDRRGGVTKYYVRQYHELYRGKSRQYAYRHAYGTSFGAAQGLLYVPIGALLMGTGGTSQPFEPAISTSTILFGRYGSHVSTSTVLADAIIAAPIPDLDDWEASGLGATEYGGDSWLELPVYEEPTPQPPSVDTTSEAGWRSLVESGTTGAVLEGIWGKIATWLDPFRSLFWFVPFFNPDRW